MESLPVFNYRYMAALRATVSRGTESNTRLVTLILRCRWHLVDGGRSGDVEAINLEYKPQLELRCATKSRKFPSGGASYIEQLRVSTPVNR
jgi:hypothetical protein